MSEEQSREDRWGDPELFSAALKKIGGRNYLGDPEVLDAMIRFCLSEVFDRVAQAPTDEAKARTYKKYAKRYGKILIGRSRAFVPIDGWNQPGGIDVFLAKELGLPETNPDDRMEHAWVKLFIEITKVSNMANEDGIHDDQWGYLFDITVERFIKLFLGISFAQQEVI